MTIQRVLIKLYSSGLLPRGGVELLQTRTWSIEGGEAAGLKIVFPQNLDYVSGSSERPLQACLASHLAPGDSFYDIGANVGFFSLIAARRIGATGTVYAFEPVSENVGAVRRNALLNSFTNVSVFEVAVGANSAAGELLLTPWDGGSSLSTSEVPPPSPLDRRAVRVIALDDFIGQEGLRPPSVVKIDVEGAELGVLQGMTETIRRFKPVLIYEVDDGDRNAFERRWKALDDFVQRLGYRVSRLESSYPNLKWHVGHSVARWRSEASPSAPLATVGG